MAAVLAYGFAESYRIEVKQFTVTSPDVPAGFDGTRIVLLTDIHRAAFFSQSRVRELVERVNALKPDLVVLGGDYVYANTDYEASCFAELALLEAPLGRFAVLGNHDYG
ncbi:MAG: metallophosphoesterase, partial [bacterium]